MMVYIKRILTFLSFIICLLPVQSQTTNNKSTQVEIIDGKSYFIHTVEKGQTLYAISKIYSISISEITTTNDIQDGKLKDGQTIKIPQNKGQNKTQQKVSIGGKDYYLHRVQKGETLFSLGRTYNLKPAIILAANPESSANIEMGTVLKIPADGEFVIPQQSTASINKENYPRSTTHTVVKGESIYGIAKKYNSSVSAIIAKNPSCRDGLQVGCDLTIPLPPNKKSFFYHKVAKGETYYSIATNYGISTDQLQKDNSAMKSSLKENTYLKIEKTDANSDKETRYPGYNFHEIEKGETVYSISKQYNIPEKKLKKLNNGLNISELNIGAILLVPNTSIIEETDSIAIVNEHAVIDSAYTNFSCDSILTDSIRPLNIVIMLPLFLDANDTISLSENIIRRQEKVYTKSLPFVEFYEGILMALDSLKTQGYSINVKVFDTQKDTLVTKAAFRKIDLERTDIIFGPIYNSTFEVASKIAKAYSIPIVSPLSSSIEDVIDNPYAIIVNTPQKYRIETTSLYVSQKSDYNFVMIHNGGVKDFSIMDTYKEVLFSSFADSAIFVDVVFKELNFEEQGIEGVQDALSISSRNIIIIPSQNQGFVNNIVTQLYQFHKKFDIDLMGLSVWEQYDNIELDYLFGLNYHFGTNYYINYQAEKVKTFIKEYRKIYKTEPTKYSFHGYDVMNYFARALNKYPVFTCECIENYNYEGLQSNFELQAYGEGKGLVNTNVCLIKYSNDFKSETIEFDAHAARKKFYEKLKSKQAQAPIFEELFSE